jgi:hypothetical protein
MPTTNNGCGERLKACFRIGLTDADKIYMSPELTFHRSDLGYSVKNDENIKMKLTEHEAMHIKHIWDKFVVTSI